VAEAVADTRNVDREKQLRGRVIDRVGGGSVEPKVERFGGWSEDAESLRRRLAARGMEADRAGTARTTAGRTGDDAGASRNGNSVVVG
jgi:hypothetical protein